jgi:hypothetical protein
VQLLLAFSLCKRHQTVQRFVSSTGPVVPFLMAKLFLQLKLSNSPGSLDRKLQSAH